MASHCDFGGISAMAGLPAAGGIPICPADEQKQGTGGVNVSGEQQSCASRAAPLSIAQQKLLKFAFAAAIARRRGDSAQIVRSLRRNCLSNLAGEDAEAGLPAKRKQRAGSTNGTSASPSTTAFVPSFPENQQLRLFGMAISASCTPGGGGPASGQAVAGAAASLTVGGVPAHHMLLFAKELLQQVVVQGFQDAFAYSRSIAALVSAAEGNDAFFAPVIAEAFDCTLLALSRLELPDKQLVLLLSKARPFFRAHQRVLLLSIKQEQGLSGTGNAKVPLHLQVLASAMASFGPHPPSQMALWREASVLRRAVTG